MGTCGPCAGVASRLCGLMSAVSRLSLGCLSAVSRLPLGCLSAASRLPLGCLSAVSRLSLGYISAASRLHLGYISATSRLMSAWMRRTRERARSMSVSCAAEQAVSRWDTRPGADDGPHALAGHTGQTRVAVCAISGEGRRSQKRRISSVRGPALGRARRDHTCAAAATTKSSLQGRSPRFSCTSCSDGPNAQIVGDCGEIVGRLWGACAPHCSDGPGVSHRRRQRESPGVSVLSRLAQGVRRVCSRDTADCARSHKALARLYRGCIPSPRRARRRRGCI